MKLSELKKKIDAKGKMEELLKTLEEQNPIVRGKKEQLSLRRKSSFDEFLSSIINLS